VTWYHI